MSSFNNIRFNNHCRIIYVDIEFKSKSCFIADLNDVSIFLSGKSRLLAEATVEKVIDVENLNSTFGGNFNNTKFNSGSREKLLEATLKGTSKLEYIEGNVSAKITSKTSLIATSIIQDKVSTINIYNGFGGKFNYIPFNLISRVNYITIKITSKSKLKYIEGNVSARVTSRSNISAYAIRIRYINVEIKSKTKLVGKINVNVNINISIIILSKSILKANIYKLMWEKIEIKSLSKLVATSNRLRFINIAFIGQTALVFNPFIISVESLSLNNLGFKPSDVIEIDLDNYYITHNGVDITYKMAGSFFRLYAGINTVKWKDNVNERKVRKDIIFQNKFL